MSETSLSGTRKYRAIALFDLIWRAATHAKVHLTLAELTFEIDAYASAFQHTYRKKCHVIATALAQLSGVNALTCDTALHMAADLLIDSDLKTSGTIDGVVRTCSQLTSLLYGARGLSYLVK